MKMGFFGCSFTEGGGLNSPVFNEYAIKNKLISKEYKENWVLISISTRHKKSVKT